MRLEDQVCTKEQGQRLKELGIIQNEAQFCQCMVSNGLDDANSQLIYSLDESIPDGATSHLYDRFTVAELGVMLPSGYDTMYISDSGWVGYDLEGNDFCMEYFKTEAECRAAMLIALIEQESVAIEECKQRLLQ